MVEAGLRATEDEVLEARLALAGVERGRRRAGRRRVPLGRDPVRSAEAGRRAFYDRDPGALVPFPFAREVLRRVRAVVPQRPALDRATRRRSDARSSRLGLEDAFDEILLDDVFGRTRRRRRRCAAGSPGGALAGRGAGRRRPAGRRDRGGAPARHATRCASAGGEFASRADAGGRPRGATTCARSCRSSAFRRVGAGFVRRSAATGRPSTPGMSTWRRAQSVGAKSSVRTR